MVTRVLSERSGADDEGSTVDREGLTGDECGSVGGEEGNGRGDFNLVGSSGQTLTVWRVEVLSVRVPGGHRPTAMPTPAVGRRSVSAVRPTPGHGAHRPVCDGVHGHPPDAPAPLAGPIPAVGVEEEFVLVGPDTGAPFPGNAAVAETGKTLGIDPQLEALPGRSSLRPPQPRHACDHVLTASMPVAENARASRAAGPA